MEDFLYNIYKHRAEQEKWTAENMYMHNLTALLLSCSEGDTFFEVCMPRPQSSPKLFSIIMDA